MNETLSIEQTLKDGTIDTLTVNKDGVWFVRKDKSNVEITQKYSHKEFLTKVNDDKDKNSSDSKIVFSLLYLLYYDPLEKVKFMGLVDRYNNKNEERFLQIVSESNKLVRAILVILISVFVILSIVAVFTFFIPLFNSIISYKMVFFYFAVSIAFVYFVLLLLIRPNNDWLSKKRLLRSFFLGVMLVGNVGTIYRFCSSKEYNVMGEITDYTRLGRESQRSRVDEYSVKVTLDNNKTCILYTKTNLSGQLNIKVRDKAKCTFKPILPGIDLLVSYKFY